MSNNNIGSVSSGTMRTEDLVPEFLYCLRNQSPCRHKDLIREIEGRVDAEGYYESEDADYDLEALFDALEEYAPEFFYFGAHPGDGADYGFWLSEEWEQDLEDLDGIKVSDLSDVPSDHYGFIAVVTDHGNVTLYRRARNNRIVELWSLV